ncbi:MAG: enoyl-CoA hydratase [Desulfatibacillaceae bacterium]|nr:enoyl-CoA hydratase [Desulfatibacillaceae bacterium]
MQETTEERPVLYEVVRSTAIITLNRPRKRNAISQGLLAGLYGNLEKAQADPAIRAIILTGAGESFCAGLDLSRLATDNLMDPRGDGRDLMDIRPFIKKPIIGAINGHAITGGMELALNCDFLIASENASFADTHAKIGIHPGWGMSQLLRRAVGLAMAKQMSFTCKFVDAKKALEIGLVNEVVPQEKLLDRCLEIADDIAKTNGPVFEIIKQCMEDGAGMSFADAMQRERDGFTAFLTQSGALKK